MRYRNYSLIILLIVLFGITSIGYGSPFSDSDLQTKRRDINPKKISSIYPPRSAKNINSSFSSLLPLSSLSFLKREYEFILFYESECRHCIEFAPILKRYAADVGVKVLAFGFGDTNKGLSIFANSTVVDQNTVAQFFGQDAKISTPALFIWNKRNGHVYPVASGMHTYEELALRMNELAPKILRKEAEL
jgi:thiol-disulfide isomerase/thioredoxin